ncbi:hypothetical protein ElyMa_002624100 [Elysia marginata]|uniref:Uncharacterized protein n=1 Tax=Elysia marginata TaxID=1093978 RepID=A0AAV4H4H6_9GAST|nr:hypothetical protein ElyMa_002624100 [Elysia marginata]
MATRKTNCGCRERESRVRYKTAIDKAKQYLKCHHMRDTALDFSTAEYKVDIAVISETGFVHKSRFTETSGCYIFFWRGRSKNPDLKLIGRFGGHSYCHQTLACHGGL